MRVGVNNRLTWILGGLVLLLTGALAGVLIMVARFDARTPVVARPSAENVRLGPQSLPPVTVPDSLGVLSLPDPARMNAVFRIVADRVTGSVVYIEVEGSSGNLIPPELLRPFEGGGRERDFSVPQQSVGSGVIVSEDGYVVTNYHVVEGADEIRVTLPDKRQYEARITGVDPLTDLAVIKVEDSRPFRALAFGDSDSLTVGEWVLAVGNPFRLTSTVTAGIVSALGRRVNIINDEYGIEDFIQTDAAINPGNSGGALVNMRGELIGISTAIATESGSYEGYGFAVPVNLMQRVTRDLIAFGQVQRAVLGVKIEEVSIRQARANGLDNASGVLLHDVSSGSAADRGGLRRGDIVVAIEERPVTATNELQREVARYRPGDLISVDVVRRGEPHRFEIELLGRDDPSYAEWMEELDRDNAPAMPEFSDGDDVHGSIELAEWGIGFRALESRDSHDFTHPGAYVAYVRRGMAASNAGLPRDVLITHVDDMPVNSVDEALHALRGSVDVQDAVLLRVRKRDGLIAFYEIEVPGH